MAHNDLRLLPNSHLVQKIRRIKGTSTFEWNREAYPSKVHAQKVWVQLVCGWSGRKFVTLKKRAQFWIFVDFLMGQPMACPQSPRHDFFFHQNNTRRFSCHLQTTMSIMGFTSRRHRCHHQQTSSTYSLITNSNNFSRLETKVIPGRVVEWIERLLLML